MSATKTADKDPRIQGFKGSRGYKREPQNIEQGITNIEGNFIIRNSLRGVDSTLRTPSPTGYKWRRRPYLIFIRLFFGGAKFT
jgi:hypothetical protein